MMNSRFVGRGGRGGRPAVLPAICAAAMALATAAPGYANIVITPTFDSSITSDPNAVAIEAGINAAISRAEAAISNNTTSTIIFKEESTGLGGTSSVHFIDSYSDYLNALQTQQTLSANDLTALATLPAGPNNPVNGNAGINVQTTLARALNIANYGGTDGTISLNTSIMNLSRTGAQNPTFYDLQAVAGHEIDEVLGIGGPGSSMQLLGPYTGQASPTGSVGVLDLFRYSATATRSFTMDPNATPSYFSIDGGVTDLVHFNQNGANGADFADWGNDGTGTGDQSGNSPPQLQDAYGDPNVDIDLGASELTALDVVGYNLAPTGVPEPATIGVMALGCAGLLLRRRGRQAQGVTPR